MHSKAFTLVELAIVLVIIGLLVGGVLAGQELIKQARLNKVISYYTDIIRATDTYRLKYNEIPGDSVKASGYFSNCEPYVTTGSCNGNGNKRLIQADAEHAKFWNHLVAANLFNPVPRNNLYTGGCAMLPYPEGGSSFYPVECAGGLVHDAAQCGYFLNADNPKRNRVALHLMNCDLAGFINTSGAGGISSADLYPIDRKVDDGRPKGGSIISKTGQNAAAGAFTTTCYDSGSGEYYPNDTDIDSCVSLFYLNF